MEDFTENQHSQDYSNNIEWVKRNLKKEKEENLEIIEIEGTPFRIVGVKNKKAEGWKIICGNAIACYKTFETKESARRYIKKLPWDLMTVLCIEIFNTEKKQETIKEGE